MADVIEVLAAAVRGERPAWAEDLDAEEVVFAADRHGVLMLLDRASAMELPARGQRPSRPEASGPQASGPISHPATARAGTAGAGTAGLGTAGLWPAGPLASGRPPDVPAALRPLVRERTERALLLVRQLRTLVSLLEAEGIDVLPVKGPLLAVIAYGDAALRGASGDLDLVVRPTDLARAVAALEKAGYRRVESALQEHDPEQWSREAHLLPPSASIGTLVEVHTALSTSPGTPSLDLDAVMARAERRPLLGRDFRLPAAEDLLLYLALHAAQHIWSRMIWTADIAALLRKPIDWTVLLERADAVEARHRLAVTLRLAVDLFQAGVPQEVQSRLFADPRVARTTRLAHRRMRLTSAGVRIPAGLSGVLLRARCELAIRETPAQRRTWLLSSIAPNAVDRAAFPLPRGLGWLRWLLHPLRLLWRATTIRM